MPAAPDLLCGLGLRHHVRQFACLAIELMKGPHRILADAILQMAFTLEDDHEHDGRRQKQDHREGQKVVGRAPRALDCELTVFQFAFQRTTSISFICQTERTKYFSL